MFYSKMGCAVLSCIRFFVMLWTVACQAPLSMGSSRQEYWSGLPCPPPEDLPDSGMEAASLVSCNGMRVLYHQCHLGRPSLRYLISYLKLKKLRKVKTAQSLYIYIYIYTNIYNFISLFLAELGLVAAVGGYSLVAVHRFLIVVASCQAWAPGHSGFSSCSTGVQWLWHIGLVVPQHVESSQTRDWTRVLYVGRQILNWWNTREIQSRAL